MRDQHVGQITLLLKGHQRVEDLRLHGNIQRAGGFIEHDDIRIGRERRAMVRWRCPPERRAEAGRDIPGEYPQRQVFSLLAAVGARCCAAPPAR